MSPPTQTLPPPQPPTTPQKIKPTLSGAQATALIAVYCRHLESQLDSPLLNDKLAGEIISKIDYNFANLKVGGSTVNILGIRGSFLDNWTRDFISRHPRSTVIHLACGLDTRAHRLDCGGEGVRWIDVDLPDVVDLRRQVVPSPPGERDYTLLAGSATDGEFIRSLPNDRPTLVVMEGLAPYLVPGEGEVMVTTICEHFKRGEIIAEVINWLTVTLQWVLGYLKQTDAAVIWGIDDSKALERLYEGLELVDEVPVCSLDGVAGCPVTGRVVWWLTSWFSFSRNALRFVRYVF